MNALPNHVVKSLKEDLTKVDYSKWERRGRGLDAPQDQRGAPWVILPFRPPGITNNPDSPVPESKDKDTTSPNTLPTTDKPGKAGQRSRPTTGLQEPSRLSQGRVSQARVFQARRNKPAELLDQDALKKTNNIKTLKLLIRARQRAIDELDKHSSALQLSNNHIASHIRDVDSQSVTSAREFLIRYEKLGSSIGAFHGWSHSQTSQAQKELTEAEDSGNTLIQGLQQQLTGVKCDLVRAQAELHLLKTYKDKEYPVKALRITQMKREILKLKDTQQDEQEDVSALCQIEILSLHRRANHKEEEVLGAVAKQHISNVPSVVRLLASHNSIMKNEIEIHKQEIARLQSSTVSLLQSIQDLQRSAASCRRTAFPQLSPSADRCLPDDEVSLNIPREKWLPI